MRRSSHCAVALTRNRPSARAGLAQTRTSVSQSHDNGDVSHRIPGKVDMANSSNLHPIRRSSSLPKFVEPVRGFANMLTDVFYHRFGNGIPHHEIATVNARGRARTDDQTSSFVGIIRLTGRMAVSRDELRHRDRRRPAPLTPVGSAITGCCRHRHCWRQLCGLRTSAALGRDPG